ncbi:MAG: N-acetyltransferase [Nocardioides sp.]
MSFSREWTTRPESQDDEDAVRALTVAAFGRADEADLVDALRADEAWIGGLSMVTTTADGQVVGHALLTRCWVDEEPALSLAPCSVLPAFQRTGAGSAAIRAALDAACSVEGPFVVVLGHPDYYPRFGFNRASLSGIRLSVDVPDEALMAMSLDPERALPRGTVHYPAPFGI